jgi:hypothetical protein
MSQPIGNAFKTRIPTFADDASIQEAFSVYHYGKDDYSEGQSIPENSIEGHFVTFNTRVGALESTVSSLGNIYVLKESLITNPNIVTSQNGSVTPLTIRGKSGQTEPLQKWENSLFVGVGSIFNDGGASFGNYVTVGNTTKSSSIALDVRIGNLSHKGIVVSGIVNQTGNLQEWTSFNGSTTSVVARVSNSGKIFSNNGLAGTNTSEVVTESGTQTLANKTISSPTISAGTISNAVINAAKTSIEFNQRIASYTLVIDDRDKVVEISSTAATTLTIPTNASVAFPIGSSIVVAQTNTGQITIAGASGVTVNGTPGLKTRAQWAIATLIKRGTNTWLVVGDTTT